VKTENTQQENQLRRESPLWNMIDPSSPATHPREDITKPLIDSQHILKIPSDKLLERRKLKVLMIKNGNQPIIKDPSLPLQWLPIIRILNQNFHLYSESFDRCSHIKIYTNIIS